jgi:hypothetical protein
MLSPLSVHSTKDASMPPPPPRSPEPSRSFVSGAAAGEFQDKSTISSNAFMRAGSIVFCAALSHFMLCFYIFTGSLTRALVAPLDVLKIRLQVANDTRGVSFRAVCQHNFRFVLPSVSVEFKQPISLPHLFRPGCQGANIVSHCCHFILPVNQLVCCS